MGQGSWAIAQIGLIKSVRFYLTTTNRIEGHQFAYCNRMRASDYLSLFEELGFDACRRESVVDEEARKSMKKGFVVDEKFCAYSVDDLYTTGFRVALKENRKAAGL